jgi:hypothetical protein
LFTSIQFSEKADINIKYFKEVPLLKHLFWKCKQTFRGSVIMLGSESNSQLQIFDREFARTFDGFGESDSARRNANRRQSLKINGHSGTAVLFNIYTDMKWNCFYVE